MKLQIARVLVGMAISLMAVCIFAGPQDGLLFIALSIVCTAGVGLVVWIPLWWLAGAAVIALVGWVRGASNTSGGPPNVVTAEVVDPLKDFIRDAHAQGKDLDEVTNRLRTAGWSEFEIQQARDQAGASSGPP